LAFWHLGTWAFLHYGNLTLWNFGIMAFWHFGILALWHFGKSVRDEKEFNGTVIKHFFTLKI